MNHPQEHQHDADRHAHRGKWVLAGFLLIAGYFLFTEHQAHVLGALPFLLLLACPLMHLFHHGGGHGHHHAPPTDGANGASSDIDIHQRGKDAS